MSHRLRRTSNGLATIVAALACFGAPLIAEGATVEVRVSNGNDDAEEDLATGNMNLTSSDLELGQDPDGCCLTDMQGMRFLSLSIPSGATITNAYVQFTVDEVDTGATSLTVYGEDADDPGTFTSTNSDLSDRTTTTASVAWSPAGWPTGGAAGTDQRTPDISTIIQEIIDRGGWSSGNDMVIIITGTGERTAHSYNGSTSEAPLLHVEYTLAPTVAGDAVQGGTLLGYSDNGSATPRHAYWGGSSWGTTAATSSVGTEPNWVVLRSCPTRTEMAMGTLDSAKDVNVLFHDGTGWSSATEVCNDVEYDDQRAFDIAYEQASGTLLIAYWDKNDGEIRYRTYDGTTVSGEGTLNVPTKCRWVSLYPAPESDEIMLIALDDSQDLQAANWSGTGWGSVSEHETNTGYDTYETYAMAYEQLSGTGLLVYTQSGSNQPRYRTWNGSSWSGESSMPSVGNSQRWLRLAAKPGSDEILFASLDDSRDVNANVWSGTAWGTNQELENNTSYNNRRQFDVGYVRGGSEGLIAYAQNGASNVRYRTWNGSWSSEITGPDVGQELRVVSVVPGMFEGEALVTVSDDGNDLNGLYYDGTTMTTTQVDGDLGGGNRTEGFMVASNPGQGSNLMVVPDPASLATEDRLRQLWFQATGWVVSLIDEADSQGQFDTAVAGVDIVYVPENVDSATLGTKLTDTPAGVVIEEPQSFDDFGLIDVAGSTYTGTQIDVLAVSHYITSPFTAGNLTITSSGQTLSSTSEELTRGGQVLAEEPSSSDQALITIDWCREERGRRVFLPWGGGAFDWTSLTDDGLTLLNRSLVWAGGKAAHWRLDETSGTTAFDTTIDPDDATLTNMAGTEWTNGRVEGALTFDGSADYLVASNFEAPTDTFTYSLWFRPTASLTSADAREDFVYGVTGSRPHLTFNKVGNGEIGLFVNVGGADYDDVVTTTTSWSSVRWHHVVFTWDGVDFRVFVNGDEEGTAIEHSGAHASSVGVNIGRRTSGDYFDGRIDDVRIYKIALAPDEVKQLYDACATPTFISWKEVAP